MSVRFAVFADLHTDYINDAEERISVFLQSAQDAEVDFALQLGDFLQPCKESRTEQERILPLIRQQPFPLYHVPGNHDMDAFSKADVFQLWDAAPLPFSFTQGGVHFVFLDTCYYRKDGRDYPYDSGDYKTIPDGAQIAVLPEETLRWLKEDLAAADAPAVLFSHHSLTESRTGIRNPKEFRAAVQDAPHGILLCVCGHEHVDRLEEKDGIRYLCLNSISYYWAGGNFGHTTYGPEIEAAHPLLRQVFPYRDPLFAIIEITDCSVTVHGRRSQIVGALPEEMHFTKPGLTDPVTAAVEDRILPIL